MINIFLNLFISKDTHNNAKFIGSFGILKLLGNQKIYKDPKILEPIYYSPNNLTSYRCILFIDNFLKSCFAKIALSPFRILTIDPFDYLYETFWEINCLE
jgi:hypothetical protein